MKTIRIFFTLLLLSALSFPNYSARADITIKQQITNTTSTGVSALKIVTLIKGRKVRTDVGDNLTTILDLDSGSKMTLMHQGKMCFLTTQENEIQMMLQMKSSLGDRDEPVPELHRSGKKKVISGFEAQEYTWQTVSGSGSFWIANSIPDGKVIHEALETPSKTARLTARIPSVDDLDGVVVHAEIRQVINPPGKMPPELLKNWKAEFHSTGTIVSITREEIDDNVFAMPEGYTVRRQ